MKTLLVILVVIAVVAISIFGGIRVLHLNTSSSQTAQALETALTGTLNKVSDTSEYSYVLRTQDDSVGINSMKVDFTPYNGKHVSVSGQYSGTVLYVDTISEVQ